MTVVDPSFEVPLRTAAMNLSQDKMKIKFHCRESSGSLAVEVTPSTGFGKTIAAVASAMKKLNHALYRGQIYAKCPKGKLDLKYCYSQKFCFPSL